MIASSLSSLQWTSYSIIAAIAGFIIITTIWWLYFDLMEKNLLGKSLGTAQNIIYGHLFIYIGLSALAVFIGFVIVPTLTFTHHLILFIFGFGFLSAGLLSVFTANALVNKKYTLLYLIFFVAVCVSFTLN